MIISLVIVGMAGALLGFWLNWRSIPFVGAVLFLAYAGRAWGDGASLLLVILAGFAPLFTFSAAFVSAGVLREVGRDADACSDETPAEPIEQPSNAAKKGP